MNGTDIRVVHTLTPRREGYVRVRVDRSTALGNPFKVKPHGPYSRGEAIALYRRWLAEQIHGNADTPAGQMFRKLVNEARLLELACWCAPRDCHADVIKSAIEHERV